VFTTDHVKLLVQLNSVLHLLHLNLSYTAVTVYICNTVCLQLATAK